MKNLGKKAQLVVLMSLTAISSGCAYFQKKGVIKSGDVQVAAVADAGKPATLNTSDRKESVPIPAGSTLVVTKDAPVPATDKTPFVPAHERLEVHFNGPTEWQRFDNSVSANTGTIDTTVAQKKIEVQAAQPLLYAAILSALGAIFFIYRAYPTPAALCGLSAALFFIAWRTSSFPPWVWGICGLGVVGGAALYFGHERGLKTATEPAKVT